MKTNLLKNLEKLILNFKSTILILLQPLKKLNIFVKKLSDVSIKTKKTLANWRMRIQLYFHYDPLVCPFCNQTMFFSELVVAKNSS